MKRRALLIMTAVLLLATSLIGTAAAQSNTDQSQPGNTTPAVDTTTMTIAEIASGADFSRLAGALTAAGLLDVFTRPGDYTVFAPTNAAFEALGDVQLSEEQLTTILLFHVVGDPLTRDQIATDDVIPTLADGKPIIVNRNGSNIIDLSGARLVATDIRAANGIVHVIDAVMVPEGFVLPAPAPAPEVTMPPADTASKTIAEIAMDAGVFTQLLSALQATGLASTFAQPGNYTVFAPTDDAFEALGDVELSEEELTSILLFHVVGDQLTRNQIATDDLIPTLSDGRPLVVNREGSRIIDISGAKLLMTDIQASNGIIHVIDRVMIP